MAIKIRNGETILFTGDSITDCGRRADSQPLGSGYVKLVRDLVTMREPAKRINMINTGISGERIPGMKIRWTDDVIRYKPDWLSLKLGINDLHSAMHGDDNPDASTPEVFRAGYDEVLGRTRDELPKCRILLIDPFYLSVETAPGSWRKQVLDKLPEYTRIVHEMSRKYDTRLVKTHEIFKQLLRYNSADVFCPEPVHPNLTGHLVIAEAVYQALSD